MNNDDVLLHLSGYVMYLVYVSYCTLVKIVCLLLLLMILTHLFHLVCGGFAQFRRICTIVHAATLPTYMK